MTTASIDLSNDTLADRYLATRARTVDLCSGLTEEDCCVQSQPCSSPTKWHLGHTTWFFERFIIRDVLGEPPYDDRFEYAFNSYYNALGERQPRAKRGLLTRPGLGEVLAFREAVDDKVARALRRGLVPESSIPALQLGLNHEQQHQELLLMDIKHLFSCSPLGIRYHEAPPRSPAAPDSLGWVEFAGGIADIGECFGEDPTIFDNECPRHRVFLEPYALGDRLVTNGDYLEFVCDGGYERAELWLDPGWTAVRTHGWEAPAYWSARDGAWYEFSLRGLHELALDEPVSHLSMYEADAYARWAGARLPTEFELEAAIGAEPSTGAMLEDRAFHPSPAPRGASGLRQQIGDLWEWTSSSYGPYPGYTPPQGAIGEYNGKFMCNQYVLRGGCCVTPRDHIRRTYRNFFHADDRWQFSGLRLARSI